jgi:hypothetical protein
LTTEKYTSVTAITRRSRLFNPESEDVKKSADYTDLRRYNRKRAPRLGIEKFANND